MPTTMEDLLTTCKTIDKLITNVSKTTDETLTVAKQPCELISQLDAEKKTLTRSVTVNKKLSM